jgi:hypothetical protein
LAVVLGLLQSYGLSLQLARLDELVGCSSCCLEVKRRFVVANDGKVGGSIRVGWRLRVR